METSERLSGAGGFKEREFVDFLILFAVKEEAAHFPAFRGHARCKSLVSGMGRRNAAECIRRALDHYSPKRVITCGFAGGLNPELRLGSIVFEEDFDTGLNEPLLRLGAVPGKFHCSKRVAVTELEKRSLWEQTGADAVEMESSVIRTICREFEVPSATVRVILDSAREDLPLDFNALMTSDDRINFGKLAWTILSSPSKIPRLMDFQKQTAFASKQLGALLFELLRTGGGS
jgi:adenosylhomocysteine nucleosidase